MPASPWAPFGQRAFAVLWLAALVSNIGTWMNDVGAGWLMTTLAPSPATVALVQAATTLPVFLFALPAGALADIVDRRRLLLVVNLLMGLTAALLTLLVARDAMSIGLLLLLTFLLGTGAAFLAPAWQAIVPSLVPRNELAAAVSLNSVGINVSRAIGPALAGMLIAMLGLAWPFLVNALSFTVILLALWVWPGEARKPDALPAEQLLPAMLAGLRYARHEPALVSTILRAVAFFAFASCYWAMLPLVARDVLGGGSGLYGMLLTAVGIGAVLGALLLPRLRAHLEINRLVLLGGLGTALAMAVLAVLRLEAAALAAALLAGASWIACLASFQVAAQTALANWVRARGLSLFLTAFFGAMAAGSILWGLVAQAIGVAPALLAAAIGLTASALLSTRLHLAAGDGSEHAASLHWPAPPVVPEDAGDQGPVMVTVDYRPAPASGDRFAALLRELGRTRRRDGAYGWQALRPLEEEGVVREVFFLPSWTAHLRQHERVTEAERRLQAEIATLLAGNSTPVVRHHLPATASRP